MVPPFPFSAHLYKQTGFWPRFIRQPSTASVYGVDAYEVEIEVSAAAGAPVIIVVGLPDAAVKESRDRVTAAVANSGYRMPKGLTAASSSWTSCENSNLRLWRSCGSPLRMIGR